MNSSFNQDITVFNEVIGFKDKFKINCIVETGTYTGTTTKVLAENFNDVHSIEINVHLHNNVKNNLNNYKNLHLHLGSSQDVLEKILPEISKKYKNVIFYLDAHWNNYWPINDEIKTIGKYLHNRAIIIIDDFEVPNRKHKYDTYDNNKLNYDYIQDALDECYSDYIHYYLNNTTQIRSLTNTGKIYILPKSILNDYGINQNMLCYSENNTLYSNQ